MAVVDREKVLNLYPALAGLPADAALAGLLGALARSRHDPAPAIVAMTVANPSSSLRSAKSITSTPIDNPGRHPVSLGFAGLGLASVVVTATTEWP